MYAVVSSIEGGKTINRCVSHNVAASTLHAPSCVFYVLNIKSVGDVDEVNISVE